MIAQGLQFSDAEDLSKTQMRHTKEVPNAGAVGEIGDFRQITLSIL